MIRIAGRHTNIRKPEATNVKVCHTGYKSDNKGEPEGVTKEALFDHCWIATVTPIPGLPGPEFLD